MTSEQMNVYPIEVLTIQVQRSVQYAKANSAKEAQQIIEQTIQETPERFDNDECIVYSIQAHSSSVENNALRLDQKNGLYQ